MEDVKIVYNRKLVFCIIFSTLVISWIWLGIISTIFILGAVYFIFFHKNPIKFDWLKKPLIVFDLQRTALCVVKQDPLEEMSQCDLGMATLSASP